MPSFIYRFTSAHSHERDNLFLAGFARFVLALLTDRADRVGLASGHVKLQRGTKGTSYNKVVSIVPSNLPNTLLRASAVVSNT